MRAPLFSLPVMGALLACQPSTTRPMFLPYPEAETAEIRLSMPEATRRLAEAFKNDSIPASRVDTRDGFIETGWFDSASGRPTRRRPLGTGTVRVRAWSDPGRPGFSVLSVETVYRAATDPSLPPREVERTVPPTHPVAVKVRTELQEMMKRFGAPPTPLNAPAGASRRAPEENTSEESAPGDDSAPSDQDQP